MRHLSKNEQLWPPRVGASLGSGVNRDGLRVVRARAEDKARVEGRARVKGRARVGVKLVSRAGIDGIDSVFTAWGTVGGSVQRVLP